MKNVIIKLKKSFSTDLNQSKFWYWNLKKNFYLHCFKKSSGCKKPDTNIWNIRAEIQKWKCVILPIIYEPTCLATALVSLPVIFLEIPAASVVAEGGNSTITVLRPILDMSRSCSLSDIMLVHRVSTIVSTCISFTCGMLYNTHWT